MIDWKFLGKVFIKLCYLCLQKPLALNVFLMKLGAYATQLFRKAIFCPDLSN